MFVLPLVKDEPGEKPTVPSDSLHVPPFCQPKRHHQRIWSHAASKSKRTSTINLSHSRDHFFTAGGCSSFPPCLLCASRTNPTSTSTDREKWKKKKRGLHQENQCYTPTHPTKSGAQRRLTEMHTFLSTRKKWSNLSIQSAAAAAPLPIGICGP